MGSESQENSSIGSVLIHMREANGITVKAVSDALHIQLRTYESYEQGRKTPPQEVLQQLAAYYQVSEDVFQ